MKTNGPWTLPSILVLISLLVASCGGAAPTPVATAIPVPIMPENVPTYGYLTYEFSAENLTTVIGKKSTRSSDLVGLGIDDKEYIFEAKTFPSLNGSKEWNIWYSFNEVADGNRTEKLICYDSEGFPLEREENISVGAFDISTDVEIFCKLDNNDVHSETLWVSFHINIADTAYAELIATGTDAENGTLLNPPTDTPTATVTPTPNSITLSQLDQTLTAGAPTVTGTLPTFTATPKGDHCPQVDDNEYSVEIQYLEEEGVIIAKATLCRLYHVGGVVEYGTYLGVIEENEWWQYEPIEVNQANGTVPGIRLQSRFIVDYDGCWKINEAGGYTYLQCRVTRPTATATNTFTATATKTSTPTIVSTPTRPTRTPTATP